MEITIENSNLRSFAETLPPCSETQIAQFSEKAQKSNTGFQKAGITKDFNNICVSNSQTTEKSFCEKHGEFESQVFEISGAIFKTGCEKCEKELFTRQAEEDTKKTAEQAAFALSRNMELSLIPLRYQKCSLDNYQASNPREQAILQDCMDYVSGFAKAGREGASLMFCGAVGTGKTHLACSVASELIKNHGKTAVYLKIANAIGRVKDTYRSDANRTAEQAVSWFSSPDLLILDEVGIQFGTEAEKRIIFQIIDERYDNMKSTILISNMMPDDFIQFLGENVTDRLKQNGGKFIIFNGISKRK